MRTFLQDAHSHLTIGTFVTTFTYALVVLQEIDLTYDPPDGLVASTSVTVAFVLAVVSLGMFISFVDHIIHQARVTSIIDRIGNETRWVIDRERPPAERAPERIVGEVPDTEPDHIVRSQHHGVILEIDVDSLLDAIRERDDTAVMIPAVGDFIPTGGRLFEVYGETHVDEDALVSTVVIDAERSITQDVVPDPDRADRHEPPPTFLLGA